MDVILMSPIKHKMELDVFIWKPSIEEKFLTASAWEVIRIKGE